MFYMQVKIQHWLNARFYTYLLNYGVKVISYWFYHIYFINKKLLEKCRFQIS